MSALAISALTLDTDATGSYLANTMDDKKIANTKTTQKKVRKAVCVCAQQVMWVLKYTL